jgi:hypothetical protein
MFKLKNIIHWFKKKPKIEDHVFLQVGIYENSRKSIFRSRRNTFRIDSMFRKL